MADELRLEASVIDKFSKPLRDLRSRLGDVKTPDGVKEMPEHFKKIHESVKKTAEAIRGGLGEALGGLGLSGLAATASIAGVIGAIRGFSGSTIEMKQFQRETGFSIQMLKAFKGAASSFGVNEDIIPGALKKLSDNLRNIKNRVPGTVFDTLVRLDPGLLKALTGKNADQALRIIEEQMAHNIGTLDKRRQTGKLAELLFGTDEMARFALRGIGPLQDALKKFYHDGAPSPDDEKKASDFEQAISALQERFRDLRMTIGNELAPVLSSMMDTVSDFIEKNKGRIGSAIQGALHAISEEAQKTDWKQLGADITSIGSGLHTIIEAFRGSGDFLDRFFSLKRFGKEGTADDLTEARNKLAEYDKLHPSHGMTGLRSGNSPERQGLVGEVKRLEDLQKATEKGVKAGLISFMQGEVGGGGGDGGGGMKPLMASYGGGSGGGGGGFGGRHGGGNGNVQDDGSGAGVSGGKGALAQRYMDRLIKVHGFTPEAAAIAAGNAYAESKFKGGAVGDGGTSGGIHQWHQDRFRNLERFAAARHKSWKDFDTQVDFAAQEIEKKLPGSKSAHDFSGARQWGHRYEGYSTRTEGERYNAGQQIYKAYKNRPKDEVVARHGNNNVGKHDGNAPRQASRLDVIFHNAPVKMSTRVHGGDHFDRVNIDRGRTQMRGA
jgi:hypothetical protein